MSQWIYFDGLPQKQYQLGSTIDLERSWCIGQHQNLSNGHRSSSNNTDNLPFPVIIILNLTKSLLIHVGMYVYSITYSLILITSTTAILTLHINSFCCLDTALVLASDDFHSIFPPLLPPPCLVSPLVALFQNAHVVPSLLCIHIHSLSVIVKIF